MIYLDNSATTKQYDEVTETMVKYMREDFGNPSSLYQLGVDAEKTLRKARKQILTAAFGRDDGNWDVIFTSGGTEADNMAIFGAAKALRRRGNKIVTTQVEHPAVLQCCSNLEREGFEIWEVGVDRNGALDLEEMERAVDENTILLSVMHVNNEVGTVMPVEEVARIIEKKKAPALLHCDGVQSFGKMSLPKSAHMIAVSGHKIHGPKGSGALLVNREMKVQGRKVAIPAFIVGGGQEGGMRSGTENVPAIAGLAKAAELSMKDRDKASHLRTVLMEGLKETIEDITINSPHQCGTEKGQCCPTVLNVSFKGTRGEVLLHTLEQEGIYVSTGSACSSNKKGQSHVLKAMGLTDKEIEGTLRFSIGRFNSEEEMDTTVLKVAEAVKRFRRLGSFR